jgi:dTDP-4-amino-4,6-dideoxygalactose transaminase
MKVPFNRPHLTGEELDCLALALERRHLSGNGPFGRACQAWIEERFGCLKALLTHSATGALEMAALLAEVGPGDEVIMPSFTFVSTANAFALRGAVPVFVDVREDSLNIDEALIEAAITEKTRAIVVVHYAGVACEMGRIAALSERHRLLLIEDAAQAFLSTYHGRPLGTIGHLGVFSFHETKNVVSGEGGALLVNDERFVERAEVLWEKGTDRSRYFRGQVDKYTWVDLGSSYLPSELVAAFLNPQLRRSREITERRRMVWDHYHRAFERLERDGLVRRPVVPEGCGPNAHLYYLIVEDEPTRAELIRALAAGGIGAVFHYVPLHSSPAGRRYGRAAGDLPITDRAGERLFRLPLFVGAEEGAAEVVVREVLDYYRRRARRHVA